MKTIKLALTVTAVAIATILAAVEKPRINVIPVNSEKAIIAIQNVQPTNFEISIKAENGEQVYYKQSGNKITEYSQVFDFKRLDKGNYVLNLKVNDTRLTNKFKVTKDGLILGEEVINYGPYFDYRNNELIISYLNIKQENIKMYLYNNNELVYETRLGSDFNLTKGYDLSKLTKGSYRVVMGSNENKYTFSLEK